MESQDFNLPHDWYSKIACMLFACIMLACGKSKTNIETEFHNIECAQVEKLITLYWQALNADGKVPDALIIMDVATHGDTVQYTFSHDPNMVEYILYPVTSFAQVDSVVVAVRDSGQKPMTESAVVAHLGVYDNLMEQYRAWKKRLRKYGMTAKEVDPNSMTDTQVMARMPLIGWMSDYDQWTAALIGDSIVSVKSWYNGDITRELK